MMSTGLVACIVSGLTGFALGGDPPATSPAPLAHPVATPTNRAHSTDSTRAG